MLFNAKFSIVNVISLKKRLSMSQISFRLINFVINIGIMSIMQFLQLNFKLFQFLPNVKHRRCCTCRRPSTRNTIIKARMLIETIQKSEWFTTTCSSLNNTQNSWGMIKHGMIEIFNHCIRMLLQPIFLINLCQSC